MQKSKSKSKSKSEIASPFYMPTWYIPHGAGPCFFMEWDPRNEWDGMREFLKGLALTLPVSPKGIVVVSAHWLESIINVTAVKKPKLIFDYYGFPKHTYTLNYPTAGDPQLASKIVKSLEEDAIPARLDHTRGIDHGVFIPMMLMFPNANIPVVQVSLNQNLDPDLHMKIGKSIGKLREEGILIIGSGMSFHNMQGYGNPKFRKISEEFDEWLTDTVESEQEIRADALSNWKLAPNAKLCHPMLQEEHLLPLMAVVGAAYKDKGRKVYCQRVLETTISGFVFE